MKQWIEYQEPKLNGALGTVLGSDGIIPLDGRYKKFGTIYQEAASRAPKRATHFYILKGTTLLNAQIDSYLISLV